MIKINDEYYINANSHCYILQRFGIVQDKESKNYGKEAYENLGYYPSLEGAINGLIKYETRKFISKEDTNTLKDLQKEIKKIEGIIKKACEVVLEK